MYFRVKLLLVLQLIAQCNFVVGHSIEDQQSCLDQVSSQNCGQPIQKACHGSLESDCLKNQIIDQNISITEINSTHSNQKEEVIADGAADVDSTSQNNNDNSKNYNNQNEYQISQEQGNNNENTPKTEYVFGFESSKITNEIKQFKDSFNNTIAFDSSLLSKYKIIVKPKIPEFFFNEKITLHNITMYDLDMIKGFNKIQKMFTQYESRQMVYKIKSDFFTPNSVEIFPSYDKISNDERNILKLFKDKEGGDCILFLIHDQFIYSHYLLPIMDDFHFDYIEIKNSQNPSSLNQFQQAVKTAFRAFVLNTPRNLMILDQMNCAIHSFGLIASFQPMIAYSHLGYALCSTSLFTALFPFEAQNSDPHEFQEYSFADLAEISLKRENLAINKDKRFTYQSVMQSRQIISYLAVAIQDTLFANMERIGEEFTLKYQDMKNKSPQDQIGRQISIFKTVSTFDVHSRLSLFNVHTFSEIVKENISSNGPVLSEAFELIEQIVDQKLIPHQHKHFRMIIDERTDYCGLEKSQNVFVIAFDFLRKLFYSSIKWLADIV